MKILFRTCFHNSSEIASKLWDKTKFFSQIKNNPFEDIRLNSRDSSKRIDENPGDMPKVEGKGGISKDGF